MKNYLILLLFVVVTTQADIYRLVDEQGNVSYSDQADSNAEQIELKGLSTYTPTPIPVEIELDEPSEQLSEDIKAPNYQINISSPKHDGTVRSNSGTFVVEINLNPILNLERGDRLMLKVDGIRMGVLQEHTQFTLKDIARGAHSLQAFVVDNKEKLLKSSKLITIYLHTTLPPPPPPENGDGESSSGESSTSGRQNPFMPRAPQMPKAPQMPRMP